ncbi:CD59 glycoprotein [Anoplopoma fimbria]|uniref:CD59 glycoprotein n=1 Tax=Anoplopoma fimbria TaxID=229290 RepID=UPI0023EC5146|nr:CD59 glycoprotein [Anoplopoma fimbria]
MNTSQSLAETETDKTCKALVLDRAMKLLVLALTVALLFTAGEALNCHRCVSKRAGESCELVEESCKPGKDACAAASFLRAPHGQYQKCMALSDCNMLQMNAYIDIKCCTEDMCNTF